METSGVYAVDSIQESDVIARFNQQSSSDAAADNAEESSAQPEPQSTAQPPASDSAAAPDEIRLTADQLQQAIATAVQQAMTNHQQENDQLRQQLTESQQRADSLQQVFRVLNINTQTSTRSDRPSGLAADFASACESAPSEVWINKKTGERFVQRDLAVARSLFLHQRDQLRRDMETLARDNGLLRGARYASDAPTVRTDILPALLDYLSLTLRETHRARYVYWQFPYYELELGKGPGDTIQVARFRWLPEPTSVADRTLTPGTTLSANSQNITAAAVSIVLGERGLGSGTPATSLPVAVPEFWIATSLLNLENAVVTRLGHDYEVYEDISIRTRYFATTRVVYNDRGSVTTTPGNVGAGDDGTLTENFLNNLYAYMSGLQIPALDDGRYVIVLHDTALAQYKNSLAAKNQYIKEIDMRELTNILQAASNKEQGRAMGYAGTSNGFHIFSTNAHSLGAAGTEGAQNETLGVGSTLTRTSLAFGRAAVARALGMEAELRRDNNDDFGRLNRWIWKSHETAGDLDVDPVINAEQQLRVIEVHTTDVVL